MATFPLVLIATAGIIVALGLLVVAFAAYKFLDASAFSINWSKKETTPTVVTSSKSGKTQKSGKG